MHHRGSEDQGICYHDGHCVQVDIRAYVTMMDIMSKVTSGHMLP